MIRRPTNLLYANPGSLVAARGRKATTRKVRSRVSASTQKIGVIDLSAKAGLLFNVLDKVNRKQSRYTFYPVEAPLPMGLGVISESIVAQFTEEGFRFKPRQKKELLENVVADDFLPLLEKTAEAVGVDLMVGLVAPMLAWFEKGTLNWNYFSIGERDAMLVSAYDVREFARKAKRPFEAAVAMLIVAQVWAQTFKFKFHDDTLGCIFDFCTERADLIKAFRQMDIGQECLTHIPADEHDSIFKCMDAIRDYRR